MASDDLGLELQGYTLATRKIVMYPHLNASGRLFGGHLLSWIDEALAMIAGSIMRTRSIVTKKMSEVIFDAPGLNGDVVEIWSRTAKEGTTSLTLECLVIVYRGDFERLRICRCTVVYVAIDPATGRPRPWHKPADEGPG